MWIYWALFKSESALEKARPADFATSLTPTHYLLLRAPWDTFSAKTPFFKILRCPFLPSPSALQTPPQCRCCSSWPNWRLWFEMTISEPPPDKCMSIFFYRRSHSICGENFSLNRLLRCNETLCSQRRAITKFQQVLILPRINSAQLLFSRGGDGKRGRESD